MLLAQLLGGSLLADLNARMMETDRSAAVLENEGSQCEDGDGSHGAIRI